jgi:hypothetical protein
MTARAGASASGVKTKDFISSLPLGNHRDERHAVRISFPQATKLLQRFK